MSPATPTTPMPCPTILTKRQNPLPICLPFSHSPCLFVSYALFSQGVIPQESRFQEWKRLNNKYLSHRREARRGLPITASWPAS